MNKIAALFLFCALQAAALCAQDFNKSLSGFKPKQYTAAADATYVKPAPVNMGAYGVMTALNAAGRDLTNKNVVAKHANVHLGVIAGKYPGASVEHSARMLGLLGSSNSPLVGDAQAIPALLGGLYKAYTGGSDAQTKTTALVSIALIAGANPQLQLSGKTCGDWALSLFYAAVTNEDNPYETRRGAVIALASMETPAAVQKISSCITKLIADNGDGEDEVFAVTSKDELVDEGQKGKSLVAALMLALESQLDGAASAEAFKFMKFYALLNTADKSCKARSMYGDPLGLEMNKSQYMNETTLLMARFILARESAGTLPGQSNSFSVMSSKIVREENDYGKVFLKEAGNAACLIPVIEDDGYKCETRKAFNAKYRTLAGSQLHYISAADNPPLEPVNFDNCLRAFTNKVMLNIAAEMVQGAVVGAVVKGAIRGAAWGLKTWSINKAYKVVQITGRTAKASKYANFGGAIGQYEEGLIKLYNFYDDAKDPVDYFNGVREAKR